MSAKPVVVVDYGRGNLLSLSRALSRAGAAVTVSADPSAAACAQRLILPGVGAFGDGMAGLKSRGLIEPLRAYCASGRPFLGICLGMQLLMSEGHEFGRHEGLGLVPGKVLRFPDPSPEGPSYKIPHMGWNRINPTRPQPLLAGLPECPWFYFVHSYYAEPANAADCAAQASLGGADFCAMLEAGNVCGVQFHPEKSGENGLAFLARWLSR